MGDARCLRICWNRDGRGDVERLKNSWRSCVFVASILAVALGGVLALTLFGIPWTLRFRQRQAEIGHRRRRRQGAGA